MTQTVEDYLKSLYSLQQRRPEDSAEDSSIGTNELAQKLGVTAGTVTSMLKTLEHDGLIAYIPRKGCRLTVKGRTKALEIVRRHRILESFLFRVLNMDWSELHNEAETLEHAVSEKLIGLMDDYLDNPSYDPHGHPIPASDGSIPRRKNRKSLLHASTNSQQVVIEIADDSQEFLEYLDSIQLGINTNLVITGRNDAAQVCTLELDGQNPAISISYSAARRIFVG